MDLTKHNIRIEIDELRLDKEWSEHSQQVLNCGIEVAECQLRYDTAESDLKLVDAKLDRMIREDPSHYGISKITEGVVTNTIIIQNEHYHADKEVNDAKYALNMAKAVSNSLEHRKRALTNLVELWLREYYSDTRPKGMTEAGEEFGNKAAYEKIHRRRRERENREEEDGDL